MSRRRFTLGGLALVGAALLGTCSRARLPAPLSPYPEEVAPTPPKEPEPAGAVHVSLNGRDDASGSADAPLRTVEAALKRSSPGSTIVMGAGSWPITVVIDIEGVTLRAAGGAAVWLEGADPVGPFRRSGREWACGGFDLLPDASPTFERGAEQSDRAGWSFVGPDHPLAADPQQVWLDGTPLQQVGGRDELGPGCFWIDAPAQTLFLADDPTGRTVLAGSRARAITVSAESVHLAGLGVRRYAPSVPDFGAVRFDAGRGRMSGCVVAGSSTIGVSIEATDVVLDDVVISGCGMLGLHAHRADRLLLNNVRCCSNNREGFEIAPVAGGAKVTSTRAMTVTGGEFSRNQGNGLWFDESVRNTTVIGARADENTAHGFHAELSSDITYIGVTATDNAGSGLQIQNTDSVRVWRSTFIGGRRGVDLIQDDRRRGAQESPAQDLRGGVAALDWVTRDCEVVDTIFASGKTTTQACLAMEDFTRSTDADTLNLRLATNAYLIGDDVRWTHVWSTPGTDPRVFTTVAAFTAATGQDIGSAQRPPVSSPTVTRVARAATGLVKPTPLPAALRRSSGIGDGVGAPA